MIIIIVNDKERFNISLNEGDEISFKGIQIVNKNNSINAFDKINDNRYKLNNNQIININDELFKVYIFKKYDIQRFIHDDILIISNNGDIKLNIEGYVYIDFINNLVINKNCNLFYRNELVTNQEFNIGDIFYLDKYIIYLSEEFIAINVDEDINIQVKEYKNSNYSCVKYDAKAKRIYKPVKLSSPSYTFNIKPYYRSLDSFNQPLFLSIGPQLTMALSTLSLSLINIYRNYMNGKDIADSLPLLILPFAMIISALVWMPLQKAYMRRNNKRRIINNEEKYHEYLLSKIEECRKYITEYNN